MSVKDLWIKDCEEATGKKKETLDMIRRYVGNGTMITAEDAYETILSDNELDLDKGKYGDFYELEPLSSFQHLTHLYLSGHHVSDLTPITHLTNLMILYLDHNDIVDLKPLSNLKELQELYLDHNRIANLYPISNLTNLTGLAVSNNQISILDPISNLVNLIGLFLSGNQISNLQPISGLGRLQRLSIGMNYISDIHPLSNLTNLKSLYLTQNRIQNLHPIANLVQLETLWIENNCVSDISPISNLNKSTQVILNANYIKDFTPVKHMRSVKGKRRQLFRSQVYTQMVHSSDTLEDNNTGSDDQERHDSDTSSNLVDDSIDQDGTTQQHDSPVHHEMPTPPSFGERFGASRTHVRTTNSDLGYPTGVVHGNDGEGIGASDRQRETVSPPEETAGTKTVKQPPPKGLKTSTTKAPACQQENGDSSSREGDPKVVKQSTYQRWKSLSRNIYSRFTKPTNRLVKDVVFLSHTGQDPRVSDFVSFLHEYLKKEYKVTSFFDAESIPYGSNWKKTIKYHVENCALFVCNISENYPTRYWPMKELDLALAANRKILPVFHSTVSLKVNQQLRQKMQEMLQSKRDLLDQQQEEEEVNAGEDDDYMETILNRWCDNLRQLESIQGVRNESTSKLIPPKFRDKVAKIILEQLGDAKDCQLGI